MIVKRFALAFLMLLVAVISANEARAFDRNAFRGGFGFIRGGVSSSQFPALPEGETGIAASYPDDAGISGDGDVLFTETFESYTTASQLTSSGNWNSYFQSGNTTIDTGQFNLGAKSLRQRMPNTGSEVSNAVVKTISPDRDEIYVRAMIRFQTGYAGMNAPHNGIRITANYTGPGTIPDGTDFMYIGVENSCFRSEAEPCYTNVYVYHPEQNDNYGEHWYPSGFTNNGDGPDGGFGSSFMIRTDVIPARGVWIAREVYLKLNTPGVRNGRVAVWDDGVLIADWQNIRFRDSGTVKIDEIQLENGGQGSSQQNDRWSDDLVVASSYIGPITEAAADTEDPTDPSSLVATAASSSQINLTWTSSTDNVGVTGYNVERCSGVACVNFSQVDTAPSNSYGDTGLSASTLYRYRVQAYDAAANTSGYSNIDEDTTDAAGGEVVADSCSESDVADAITAASAGDQVTVPAGSCTWNNLDIAKAVSVVGAGIGSTNITLGSGNSIAKQSAGPTYLRGFSFSKTGGGNPSVGWNLSGAWQGTEPIIIEGNEFDISGTGLFHIDMAGGVVISRNDFTGGWDDSFIKPKDDQDSDGSWSTASSMGTDDTSGELNLYIEDNTFYGGTNQGIDCDDSVRCVYRYNTLTYSSFNSHGFASSPVGVRHFEVYNNLFEHGTNGTSQIENQGWMIWIRGGTGKIFNNFFEPFSGSYWGGGRAPIKLNNRGLEDEKYGLLANGSRTAASCGQKGYPEIHGLGQSATTGTEVSSGTAYLGTDLENNLLDPIYIWNNAGTGYARADWGDGWNWGNPCGFTWSNIFQEGRDFETTADGSYTAYTYPHPLRTLGDSGTNGYRP